MSYQVLARKYRPQRFEDVVGQEHVTRTLANAIKANRIAHAYLFTGPRGTGKTTLARIFAKCLNATDGPRVDFADNDPRCVEIAEGRSLDVLEIDGASNNGVEQVRELRDTCRFAPAASRYKIYIIDEVHMLTTQAFNALLKTLEEPPEHVKFLFATTDPEKVLITILSRCQRFDLRRIPIPLIVEHLTAIAKSEKVEIEPAALQAIARGADGGMRDAESTLDQLISFCGDKIVESDVLSMFGLTAQSQLLALSNAILNADGQQVIHELDALAKGGKDLSRLVSDLLNHFRNLMMLIIAGGRTDQIEASEAERDALAQQVQGLGLDQVRRIMEVLADCEWRLRDAVSRKTIVEIALLRAMEARQAVSLDTVLNQLKTLQSEAPAANPAPSQVPPAQPAAPRKPTPPDRESQPAATSQRTVSTPKAPASTLVEQSNTKPPASNAQIDVGELWQLVLAGVGRASPFSRTYLLEAHPVSFDKKLLTIGFAPEYSDHIGLVDNSKNHDLIATKLKEAGFPNAKVKFIEAEPPAGWQKPAAPASEPAVSGNGEQSSAASKSAPAEPEFDPSTFRDDPLIKKALEVFKGQIVDVRS